MKKDMTTKRVLQIFKELNQIPRPSHHEERVADYLCKFAQRLHLEYERNAQNCVVIRKPATKGHESAEPIVLLNHMDMVCVGMKDPLNDPIDAYTENGWMKARGTSTSSRDARSSTWTLKTTTPSPLELPVPVCSSTASLCSASLPQEANAAGITYR